MARNTTKPVPRIVLHIGRQKTGTTSIQRFLAANEQVLADAGILYPKTGRLEGGHSAHHELAVALNENESDGHSLQQLRKQLSTELLNSAAETIIFSSEAFQRLHRPQRLHNYFDKSHLQVVCYLRECLAAKQSSWLRQYMHLGSELSLLITQQVQNSDIDPLSLSGGSGSIDQSLRCLSDNDYKTKT